MFDGENFTKYFVDILIFLTAGKAADRG